MTNIDETNPAREELEFLRGADRDVLRQSPAAEQHVFNHADFTFTPATSGADNNPGDAAKQWRKATARHSTYRDPADRFNDEPVKVHPRILRSRHH